MEVWSLHERVWYGHRANYHDVHEQRHHDDALVEAYELIVLCEAVADEIGLDGLEEVPVQGSINHEVETLLNSVPVLIDSVVFAADLQAGRDPNGEH